MNPDLTPAALWIHHPNNKQSSSFPSPSLLPTVPYNDSARKISLINKIII